MFHRILVPLDGSKSAERAIPLAAGIAHASSGSLVFLRVVLPTDEVGTYAAGMRGTIAIKPEVEATAKDMAEANSYLAGLASTYAAEFEGLEIETEAVSGATAQTIFATARHEHTDLIVMCSHGETGLKRWVMGSVAHEAVRHSSVPVLVLNEHGVVPSAPAAGNSLRIVVPVDGSSLAEQALEPAAQLVAAFAPPAQGELHLLRVVNLPPVYGKMKSQAHISDGIHEEAMKEAETYVQTLAEKLRSTAYAGGKLSISSSIVDSTDVAGTIIKEAETTTGDAAHYDVIAIATHGWGGLRRAFIGSVAEHLLGHTRLPLLIVRPAEEEAKGEESGQVTEVVGKKVELQTWSGLL